MASYRGQPVDFVIDVRSQLEYTTGHLDNAECIPVNIIADVIGTRAEITPNARLLVYCASGGRSAMAADMLRALGYRNVTDAGGYASALADYAP